MGSIQKMVCCERSRWEEDVGGEGGVGGEDGGIDTQFRIRHNEKGSGGFFDFRDDFRDGNEVG